MKAVGKIAEFAGDYPKVSGEKLRSIFLAKAEKKTISKFINFDIFKTNFKLKLEQDTRIMY